MGTLPLVSCAALAVTLAACSHAPAEPDAPAAAASAAVAVAVEPLRWDVPGSWTVLAASREGERRALYQAPQTGNDKEGAQIDVLFFGTGSGGDQEKTFKAWFDQFDGNVGLDAKREAIHVHGLEVALVEVAGTYKIDLSPPMGPGKRSAAQAIKKDFRLHGACVKTADRGTWFFKMVGPDETVQAARSAFRTLIDSVR